MSISAIDYSQRLPAQLYAELRIQMLESDPDAKRMLQWATQLKDLPISAEKCASEIIWIILCAGRSAQAARTIEAKVWRAIHEGRPVVKAFGYRAKAAAIERAWLERKSDFDTLKSIAREDTEALLAWMVSIPFIGDDTKYQLAKNFGVDVCKPDIWLCRLAGIPDQPRRRITQRFRACFSLCSYLSGESHDSIAVVDSMLWLACNKGVLNVSPEAGPITLTNGNDLPLRRSIFIEKAV